MNEPLSFFVANAWRWAAGLPEIDSPEPLPDLAELRRTEWCDEFEKAMRDRLVMGAFRYGRLRASGKPSYSRIASILKRPADYERHGNLEKLVDIANLCLCEFVEGEHPRRHWSSLTEGDHVSMRAE